MRCTSCGSELVSAAGPCAVCGQPVAAIPAVDSGATVAAPFGDSDATIGVGLPAGATGRISAGPLAAGQAFGPRYHIIRVLGAGGMGVVYQAWDEELGVAVALKVIRPEVLLDPGSAGEVERRFKRELVLARQVTHKHVVRIHDLGELQGIKYLTMPFVEGEDLAGVLKQKGKLPIPEALAIAKQVASGLAAAHEVGVVHRDLKPENIMIAADGGALIMDFGISRSVTGTGTQTAMGAVMGTLEYMAPEQAQGQPVDQRADIYSFGLVVYDMILGRQRIARRDNPMSEMMSRMQQAPEPIRSFDPSVPEAFDRVLTKCLQPSADARYGTTAALVEALEQLTPDGHQLASINPAAGSKTLTLALAGALAAVLIVGGLWAWRTRGGSVPAPVKPVSVLIADFKNSASDPVFDGLLEQAMAIGVEGASFVTVFPRRDALRQAQTVGSSTGLSSDVARLISISQGIDMIVDGAITRNGDGYRLTVHVVQPGAGGDKQVLDAAADASSRDQVLPAVGQLATRIREGLGDSTAGRTGDAETFTAASLDAAHAYAKAQELTWAGQTEAAIGQYQEAIRLDSNFGRAYSGLAALYFNSGRRDEAAKYYQDAMRHTDRMTEREKYRTRGAYYLMVRNSAKADEELGALVAKYPADSAALANLAVNRVYDRDMAKALELGRRAVAIYPKNVIRRNNVALFAMYAGQFDVAEKEAKEVLQLNPEFPKAFVALAMSQLGQARPEEALATWQKLQAVPGGKTFAVAGLADLALFRGRLAEAAAFLEGAADPKSGFEARRLVTLAETRLIQGNVAAATGAAAAAVASGRSDPAVLFLAGRVFAEARRPQAAEIAAALQREIDREPQIYGALLAGEVALRQNDIRAAFERFQQAQKLADTWLGRYGLGRANLALDKFIDAESEFDRCLTKRGEATAAFLDEIATYRLLPPVHYYLGLAKTGLNNSKGAAESFQAFLELKKDGDEQGLVADARKRLAQPQPR